MKKILILLSLIGLLSPFILNATVLNINNAASSYKYTASNAGINGGSISMGCWAFLNANAAEQVFEEQNSNGVNVNYVLQFDPTVVGFVRNANGISAPEATISVSMPTKEWFFLGGTYSSTSTNLNSYLFRTSNRTWSSGSNTASGNGNPTSNSGIFLGIHQDNTSIPLNGYLGNCFIFNYELTAAQIKNYAFHSPRFNEFGIVALYRGDANTGNTVVDYSKNRFNASVITTINSVVQVSPPIIWR